MRARRGESFIAKAERYPAGGERMEGEIARTSAQMVSFGKCNAAAIKTRNDRPFQERREEIEGV